MQYKRPLSVVLWLVVLVNTFVACAPFKVVPRVEVPPASITGVVADGALELRAQLLSEDEVVKLFDGNLWLAGIIPIRVVLTNRGEEVLLTNKFNFQLKDAAGHSFQSIKAPQALEKMRKYYGVRLYSNELYKEMQARFISHSFNLEAAFTPSESRQGLIFFTQTKERPAPAGLRLELRGATAALALPLN
ncbi:MAG: hypothetical protein AB1489_31040 [Acidobacteriota bacterium]